MQAAKLWQLQLRGGKMAFVEFNETRSFSQHQLPQRHTPEDRVSERVSE